MLEDYVASKAKQFQTSVQVAESVIQALNREEAEQLIEKKLNAIFAGPDEYYLSVLGVSKESLKPMVKPAILSLCAEATTLAAGNRAEYSIAKVCPHGWVSVCMHLCTSVGKCVHTCVNMCVYYVCVYCMYA